MFPRPQPDGATALHRSATISAQRVGVVAHQSDGPVGNDGAQHLRRPISLHAEYVIDRLAIQLLERLVQRQRPAALGDDPLEIVEAWDAAAFCGV